MQGLGSLGVSWILGMKGKSKTWYKNLDYIQNVLIGQTAEINAIGESTWNGLATANPKVLPPFKPQIADLEWRLKQILVTKNYIPTDKSIKLASDGTKAYRSRLNFVKKKLAAPQAAAVTNAGKSMYAKMTKLKLRSPAAAGTAAFLKELENRTKALIPSGWPWYVWAGIGLGGLIGIGYVVRSFGGGR